MGVKENIRLREPEISEIMAHVDTGKTDYYTVFYTVHGC